MFGFAPRVRSSIALFCISWSNITLPLPPTLKYQAGISAFTP